MAEGAVAANVYQGGHVDLYVDAPRVAAARLLVRLPGQEAVERWPVGARIALTTTGTDAVAFPAEG